MSEYKFDINEQDFNLVGGERTKKRLIEIADCGMGVVGCGQFGYPGVMSGLYIEKVWNYSDEAFKDYMGWAKGLIKEKVEGLTWIDDKIEEYIKNNRYKNHKEIMNYFNLDWFMTSGSLERLVWHGIIKFKSNSMLERIYILKK